MRWGNNGTEELEQRVEKLEIALRKIVHILSASGSPTAPWMKTLHGDPHKGLAAFMPETNWSALAKPKG